MENLKKKKANPNLSAKVLKVKKALEKMGVTAQMIELPETAKTAAHAARAIGCEAGQIAKSIIFKTKYSQRPILVIASGINQVNEGIISSHLNEPVTKADPEYVRERTGFAIGGVAPVGHLVPIKTFIDEALLLQKNVWAAAGHPKVVLKLTPQQLGQVTHGKTIRVA